MASGGLDSAVLLAELAAAESGPQRVVPVYIRCGLYWEQAEQNALRQFIAAVSTPKLDTLKVFELPLAGVYGDHWSATGRNAPDSDTPDEAVYLPGRNLLLLALPAVWCALNGISVIALGHLQGNPFPDSTEKFFSLYTAAINAALDSRLRVVQPYRQLSKREVLLRGQSFPLGLTWSCLRPVGDRQCGRCNKCAERKRAFREAGLADPTLYDGGD
jgi:7-cyano-7-deazaguanine synthase